MAILVSPSNNSGWGLGVKDMYGGALKRSANHPVAVRKHYRAPWGSKTRRTAVAMTQTDRDAINDTIDDVVRAARGYTRPAASSIENTINNVVRAARNYRTRNAIDDTIDRVIRAARRYRRKKRVRNRVVPSASYSMLNRTLRRLWNRRRRRTGR